MRLSLLSVAFLSLLLASVSPVNARTIHVHDDGSGDAPTIAAAIDSAIHGDTVLVHCGVYSENALQLKSGVRLLGETGDPACAVIDGGGTDRILACPYGDSTTVVAGITFRNGYAPAGDGGAVYIGEYMSPARPRFRDCRFESNDAYGQGGAVFIYDQGRPRFVDCFFEANEADGNGGAVAAGPSAQPRFERCDFVENDTPLRGGALFFADATGVMHHCGFHGNVASQRGGAVAAEGFGTVTVDSSVFAGNGAGVMGGALFVSNYGYGSIHNCTMIGNAAPQGSAIAFGNASGYADRTILAFNTGGAAVYLDLLPDTVTFTCSDIFGNPGGDWTGDIAGQLGVYGNFSEDPLFCDELLPVDSLTLRYDSPCAEENNQVCGRIGARPAGCLFQRRWVGWGDGESWGDAYNWDPTGVPDSEEVAVIRPDSPDTILFSGGDPVYALDLGSALAPCLLRIESDTLVLLHGGANEAGALRVAEGAAMEIAGGEAFTNGAWGEVILAGGDLTGAGTFVNGGALYKDEGRRGSRAISSIGCGFDNRFDDPGDGAIHVWDGVLNFQGELTNAGSLAVDEGAEALLDPGDGMLRSGRGDPSYRNTGVVTVGIDGVLRIGADQELVNDPGGEVLLRGSILDGDGAVRNSGAFRCLEGYRDGRIGNTIACVFENAPEDPGDGCLTVESGTVTIEEEFTNAGSLQVNLGAQALFDPGDGALRRTDLLINTGIIFLDTEALLTLQGPDASARNDGTVLLEGAGIDGEGTFVNAGRIDVNPGWKKGRNSSVIDVAFENVNDDPGDGCLTLSSGTLTIEQEFANAGSLQVSAGAQALFDPGDGMLRTDGFLNEGWIGVDLDAVFTLVDSGAVLGNANGGVVELRGGHLTGEGLLRNEGLLRMHETPRSGGRAISNLACRCENMKHDDPGDGAIRVEEGLLSVTGEMENDGDVHVEDGGGMAVGDEEPTPPFARSGAFRNGGTIVVEAGAFFDLNGRALENERGGSFQLGGGALIGGDAEWINDGLFTVAGSGSLTVAAGGTKSAGSFRNRGELWIPGGGSVINEGEFLHEENALLGGSGTFDNGAGSFTNDGILRPGAPIGTFQFVGDLAMSPLSEVDIDIGGTTPGDDFDRLLVTGSVDFDGAVQVSLAGYAPVEGDAFQVIQGSGGPIRSGAIACYGGLGLPGGLYLQPVQEPSALSFLVTDAPPPNGAPVAADDQDSTGTNEAIVLALLENDVEPDGDPLRILLVGLAGTAGDVRIDPGDSTVTYTPPAGFIGPDLFTYVASDCEGGSDSATVTLHVGTAPRVIRVPADEPTIAAGLAAAVAGDTVLVAPGEYAEHDLVMKGGVKLIGEDRTAPKATVNAGGAGRGILCAGFHGETLIEGIAFVNGAADSGAGARSIDASPLFRNCAFTGNAASGAGGGFHGDLLSVPEFRGCTFAGNRAPVGGGVAAECVRIEFRETVIRGNGAGAGAEIFGGPLALLEFSGCMVDTAGIEWTGGGPPWTGVLHGDPLFCAPADPAAAPAAEGIYRVDVDSPCLSGMERIGAYGAGCRDGRIFEEEEEGGGHRDRPERGEGNALVSLPATPRFFVFPNPSRGGVTVEYALPGSSSAGRLSVYGVSGRLVRSYELTGSSGAIRWDGNGADGRRAAPGVYFLRLTAGERIDTRRVTLVR